MGKRMGLSLREMASIGLQTMLAMAHEWFVRPQESKEKADESKVRDATQADIDRLFGRRC